MKRSSLGTRREFWIGGVLVALGLFQMAGDLVQSRAVKGLAAAWGFSPAPKVFSSVGGLETYSTRFFLEWTRPDGGVESVELTPEVYSRMRGPYNRRNVYGAALAYGPILSTQEATEDMYNAVSAKALCGDAPLLVELGLEEASERVGPIRIRLVPIEGTDLGDLPSLLEAPCP